MDIRSDNVVFHAEHFGLMRRKALAVAEFCIKIFQDSSRVVLLLKFKVFCRSVPFPGDSFFQNNIGQDLTFYNNGAIL